MFELEDIRPGILVSPKWIYKILDYTKVGIVLRVDIIRMNEKCKDFKLATVRWWCGSDECEDFYIQECSVHELVKVS